MLHEDPYGYYVENWKDKQEDQLGGNYQQPG